jgi:hypothetical protein
LRDTAARPDKRYWVRNRFDKMIIRLTNAERDTILAALRRWQSYPAAREADSIATNAGKHKPLDNAEIERVCKRITKIERKRDAMAPASRKRLRLRDDVRTAQDSQRASIDACGTIRSLNFQFHHRIVDVGKQ